MWAADCCFAGEPVLAPGSSSNGLRGPRACSAFLMKTLLYTAGDLNIEASWIYIFQMSKVLMTTDSGPTAFLPDGKAPKTLLKSLIKPRKVLSHSPLRDSRSTRFPFLQHHHIGEVLRSVLFNNASPYPASWSESKMVWRRKQFCPGEAPHHTEVLLGCTQLCQFSLATRHNLTSCLEGRDARCLSIISQEQERCFCQEGALAYWGNLKFPKMYLVPGLPGAVAA